MAVNTALMFSTGTDDWQTPPELFDRLNAEFGFTLDVAASSTNALCDEFIDEAADALTLDWSSWGPRTVCWCNPPYSRGRQRHFIRKAAEHMDRGVTTVMLIPARTDTVAFHRYIWDEKEGRPYIGVEVRFLKGRLKFVGAPASAPFPSMIVIFRPDRIA